MILNFKLHVREYGFNKYMYNLIGFNKEKKVFMEMDVGTMMMYLVIKDMIKNDGYYIK